MLVVRTHNCNQYHHNGRRKRALGFASFGRPGAKNDYKTGRSAYANADALVSIFGSKNGKALNFVDFDQFLNFF